EQGRARGQRGRGGRFRAPPVSRSFHGSVRPAVAAAASTNTASPREERPRSDVFDSPEVYGGGAINRIVRRLPLIERSYAFVRFSILRPKLLSVMDLLLPEQGTILDVGCGFGLFAAYFGQTHPRRSIVGVDPNQRRVDLARNV